MPNAETVLGIDKDIVLVFFSVGATLFSVWLGHYLGDSYRKKSAERIEKAIYSELSLIKDYFLKILPSLIKIYNYPIGNDYSTIEDVNLRYVDALYIELIRHDGHLEPEQVKALHNLHALLNGILKQGTELDSSTVVNKVGLRFDRLVVASYITHIVDFAYLIDKFSTLKSDFSFEGIEVKNRRLKKILNHCCEGDELDALVRNLENHLSQSSVK